MLHEQDSLTQEHDQWRLSVSELGIPAKIKDIILQRISTLMRNQRRVLDAASVIGEKFDVELLGAVLGQDSLEVLETLNAVAQSTSLVFCEEGSFRFDHAKSRDAICEEIPPALKKGYHARIAERLESASKGGKPPFSDLAYHYAQAGNKEKAVKYALGAGEDALARWSNQEAIKHFTYVLESISENPENAEAKRKAQEGLGDAYYANSMFKEAMRTFEDLSNSETGVAKLRALRKAIESAFGYQDITHLMELVKKAEPYAIADRLESARVLTTRARVYVVEGMYTLALEDMGAALRVFEEEYSLWDAALALMGVGMYHAALGESHKGLAESLRAIALYEELGDLRLQMEAYYVESKLYFAWTLERQGQSEEAKVQFGDAQKTSREAEERFAHVTLQMGVIVRREVRVGEEFEMRLDLVNVSRKPSAIVKAEMVIPSEGFKVTALPPWCSLQNGSVEMKNREIGAFQVVTVKLALQAVKTGAFILTPKAVYLDDLGESRTCELDPITVTVGPAKISGHAVAGRVSSDFGELDDLLLGGIPENYAVALTSPSTDERELLVKRFLEAGTKTGETTFHITAEAANTKALAEKYPSNFYLFVCNPQADAMIQDLPNVFKLKGVENLTDIDIALTRAFRTLNPSAVGPKRICIEVVSDALLQHHAVTTRRWLAALLPTLKSKGFTTLAVINPQMHPAEETEAVLGLFEGEININEKETPKGTARFLKIKRLTNQKYLKDETLLTEE